MTDKKSSESRRKLLKSIAAGSGAILAGKSLPESWSRPVVDSVMLPAHAQTSPADNTPPQNRVYSGTNLNVAFLDNASDSMFANTVDLLVPTANAQSQDTETYDACATPNGTNVDVLIQVIRSRPNTNDPILTDWWSGSLPLAGDPGTLTVEGKCKEYDATEFEGKVLRYDDIEMEIQTRGREVLTIPFVPSCVPFSAIQCLIDQN